jgi:glucoselysine-6-phosphate deglycase
VTIAAYIREQPETIRRVFAHVPALMSRIARDLPARPDAVALIGSGTSRHALLATESFLGRRLRCPTLVSSPRGFIAEPPAWARHGSLALLLSQSGESTTTVDALRFARARGMATLAVTAEATSPIARATDSTLVMPIGAETVGPKTKGYTGSLATLLCIGLALSGFTDWARAQAEANDLAETLTRMPSASESWATTVAERHASAPHCMILAQGRHVGTAHEAALKITEMTGLAVAAFEIEEALHGRFHALDRTTPAFFVARSDAEVETARAASTVLTELGIPDYTVRLAEADDLRRAEASPPRASNLTVGLPRLDALPELDLVPAIVPFQWLAHALAVARSLSPERMRYPGLSARLGIKSNATAGD